RTRAVPSHLRSRQSVVCYQTGHCIRLDAQSTDRHRLVWHGSHLRDVRGGLVPGRCGVDERVPPGKCLSRGCRPGDVSHRPQRKAAGIVFAMTRIRGAAWIMGAFVVGALTMLPLVTSSRSVLTWGFLVFLYAALAQSWNLLGGLAGQVSLGHAAFFGLGAFVTRVLWLGGQSLATALAAGTAVVIAAGILIGAPTVSLRGPDFAMGKLAVSQVLRIPAGHQVRGR